MLKKPGDMTPVIDLTHVRGVARRQSHDSEEDQLAEWIVGGRGDFLIRQIHDSQRHQRACTSADVFLRELA
jgi:hypothetical protein